MHVRMPMLAVNLDITLPITLMVKVFNRKNEINEPTSLFPSYSDKFNIRFVGCSQIAQLVLFAFIARWRFITTLNSTLSAYPLNPPITILI